MLWRSLSHLERSHMGQLVNSPDWSWGQICEWSSYRQCQPHPFESFQLRSQTWLEQRKNIPSEPWKILHTESVAYCNDYFKLLSLCVLLSKRPERLFLWEEAEHMWCLYVHRLSLDGLTRNWFQWWLPGKGLAWLGDEKERYYSST